MIHDRRRAFYMGASDTDKVVGNYNTATWKKWWLQKLGLNTDDFQNKAMRVGNAFEGKILDTIPGIEKDGQIIIEHLGLRVNYDGILGDHIYEVKTYSSEEFKLSKAYWRQAQAEMFAFKCSTGRMPELTVLAYRVTETEYENYFTPVDKERIVSIPVPYDEDFIEEYVPRLTYLHECVQAGKMPTNDGAKSWADVAPEYIQRSV